MRVTLTDRSSVADALRSGRADLALGVFGPSVPGFRTETLFEDDFVIVGATEHPIFRLQEFRPTDLTSYSWVLVSALGDAVGQLDDALRPLGLERRVLVTVPNFMHVPPVIADTDLLVALGRRFSSMAVAHWPLARRELPLRVSGFAANMMWLAQRNDDPALDWMRSRIRSCV
jgi:DNA-binding transcriptional LysR family regulator